MSVDETVQQVASASSLDARVAAIRQIPEKHGRAQLRDVYAAVASELYVPHLTPDFAHVHWREAYELDTFETAYTVAAAATDGFVQVGVETLVMMLRDAPETVIVLRTIVGYTRSELAATTKLLPDDLEDTTSITEGRIRSMEEDRRQQSVARCRAIAETVNRLLDERLFPDDAHTATRRKQDKPDTSSGWVTVAEVYKSGVPYSWLLHQRHYGGAFRQLLDSTSQKRGDVIEDAVEELLADAGVPFIRTGSHNQAEIARRFGLTVQPAPDFVMYGQGDTLRALLEAKGANDGGTARDKAARFATLRSEGQRLGGVPVFAALQGLGWERVRDALGPVVQSCDGRVFTLSTLPRMLEVDPLPQLVGAA